MSPQKTETPAVGAAGAISKSQLPAKFSAKSTQTEAQYERILKMLRTGPRSTFDFRKSGIMAPAARIKELNDNHGYYIPTIALRDLWDEEGFKHPRVAIYELVDEPIATLACAKGVL